MPSLLEVQSAMRARLLDEANPVTAALLAEALTRADRLSIYRNTSLGTIAEFRERCSLWVRKARIFASNWRGLKGTPSRDKTQQNSAANVGCGSAADEIVRPSAPCSRTRTTVTLDLPSEERWGYNLPT